jgi:hypothetical protein
VQSIPLLPSATERSVERTADEPTREISPDPIIAETPKPAQAEESIVITRPAPERLPIRREAPEIIERTVAATPLPETALPETAVSEAAPQPPAPADQGFTLRFETDEALTRLVARNEVGLYAITPDESLRMNVNRAAFSFWPASVPNRFHEMDETTVPDDVLAALRRAGSVRTGDVKWGVTLPADMRSKLNTYLDEYQGGALIIGVDGDLRLEP